MMLLKHEWLKVFGRKGFLMLLAGCMILNVVLMYVQEYQYSAYDPGAYKQLHRDLQNVTNREALDRLKHEQLVLQVVLEVTIFGDESAIENSGLDLDWPSLLDRIQSGTYLKYTDNIWTERQLFQETVNYYEGIMSYDRFLDNIQSTAKTTLQSSLFADPNSFSYRNITKKAEKYSGLQHIKLQGQQSKGVALAAEFQQVDLFAVVLMMIVVVLLLTREKERGGLPLIKTTFNGRSKLMMTKLTIALLSSGVILICLYSVNLLGAISIYGLGDLKQEIQSVEGYFTSPYSITIGEFLLLLFMAKLLAYMLVICLMFFTAVWMQTSVGFYLVNVTVLGISAILYQTIPSLSTWSVFKYLNLVHYMDTHTLFSQYLTLNLFGYSVDYATLFICTSIALATAALVSSIVLFSKQKETRQVGHDAVSKLKNVIRSVRWLRRGRHVGLFRHEGFKILMHHKILIILVLFIGVQIYQFEPMDERFQSVDDYFYKQYMLRLEGPLTAPKLQYINEERERFEDIQRQLELVDTSSLEGEYLMQVLSNKLLPRNAFQRVEERVTYIKELEQSSGRKAWFLYDSGYNMLTGEAGNERDLQLAIIGFLLLVACVSAILTYELQRRLTRINLITKHGRFSGFRVLWLWAMLLAFIIWLGVYVPEILSILKTYGVRAIDAPVYSLPHLNHIQGELSIVGYLLVLHGIRLIALMLGAIVVFVVSVITRSLISTALMSSIVLGVPILLALLGSTIFNYLLLTPLVTGNVLFKNYGYAWLESSRWLYLMAVLTGAIALIGFGHYFVKRRYFKSNG